MKILVYDVAAEDGGGLVVLKYFYREVVERTSNNIEWVFAVSQDILKQTEKVRVLIYDKPKKSWIHRLVFENIDFPRVIKSEKPDIVISLQNMPVQRYSGRQFVYLHQSLQYCPKKFSFLKKEERKTAIRQHIICKIYRNVLPKSEHIFVQTNWIKDATKQWLNWPDEKITVVPVEFQSEETALIKKYNGRESKSFFYPARAEIYKNHEVVIEACKKLKDEGINGYRVIFTISADDGAYALKLIHHSQGLPIDYIGAIPYEQMWDYYSRTILLFPSYLETCGLPMLEAQVSQAWILASDMPFSHEALDEYPNKEYFAYDSADDLAKKMKEFIKGKEYQEIEKKAKPQSLSLVESMLKRV